MKFTSIRKHMILILVGLFGWLTLLLSPIGHYVAISTILVLIVVFFVIGVIDIHQPKN